MPKTTFICEKSNYGPFLDIYHVADETDVCKCEQCKWCYKLGFAPRTHLFGFHFWRLQFFRP